MFQSDVNLITLLITTSFEDKKTKLQVMCTQCTSSNTLQNDLTKLVQ